MYNFSITSLLNEQLEDVCQDIKYQYDNKIADCALFTMPLFPDGTPPENKAEKYCAQYDKFKNRLNELDLECGVLVQSTIGHGPTTNNPSPFQKLINFNNGNEVNSYCPYDEGFRKYLKDSFIEIAKRKPKYIMVDDDFRILNRPGKGCGCPLHMKRFNELTGTSLSREDLYDIIVNKKQNYEEYYKTFIQIQSESLIGAAKAMREGIDSISPKTIGAFCSCGNEFVPEIAKILAGNGNPVTIRLNSSNYTTPSFHWFSLPMYNAAKQINTYTEKIDNILAETDTCPHNRYSKGAQLLHAHFTGLIIEGVNGAKHWISNIKPYEHLSEKAYKDILKKHSGFYRELENAMKDVTPFGCNCPVPSKPYYDIDDYNLYTDPSCYALGWSGCVLERLGLPMYFSSSNSNITFFNDNSSIPFTNEEMKEFFKGTVVLASDTCQQLNGRGLLEYTGVEVSEWNGKIISGEQLIHENCNIAKQHLIKQLIPVNNRVKTDSYVYHLADGKKEPLFPAVTVYKNPLGGKTIVFCGTPQTDFVYTQAFSMLNAARKEQLIRLLNENLPIYYPDDSDIYLRAGYHKNKGIFCGFFNIALDPFEEIILCTKENITSVQKLMPDGSYKDCTFTKEGNRITIYEPAYTMNPVILFLK